MKVLGLTSLTTLALLLCSLDGSAQKKLASVSHDKIRSVYIDRPGDLYVLQENNSLWKYDNNGTLIRQFSLGPTANFDPRDGARWFIYKKHVQTFSFFTEEYGLIHKIEPQYAIGPIMACASGDNHAWILDSADWSLKRVDPANSKILADAAIDQKQFGKAPEFIFIREYQSFLFLIEKNKGIIVFNSLGHQIKKIAEPGVTNVNFLGEELYYKKGDKLIFYDLFDGSSREMPIDPACKLALLTDVRKYIVYEDRIEIFENQ